MFTLNWTQNLTKSTERALALETYLLLPDRPDPRRARMTRESEAEHAAIRSAAS